MSKIIVASLLLIILHYNIIIVLAQSNLPVDSPLDNRKESYAFTNATIYVDYQTIVKNATLIIEKGIIKQIGNDVKIPAHAIVLDMKGKFIYPSFVDLAAQYGIVANKPHSNAQPQYNTNTKGAFSTNEAIKCDQEAYKLFKNDQDKAADYRKAGFGSVLSYQADGFARGTSTFVALSNKKENESILIARAAAHYSFDKGTSTQVYPNSLMGYIALIRQTFYDASWYRETKERKEININLESLNNSALLPQIFDAGDKFNILRADKIGDEFGKQFIINGSGNEYQQLDAIKKTNAPIIIPVNFPLGYDVEDPLDAQVISYIQMKHWEMAPFNAYFLNKNQIPFTFTSQGLKDKNQFIVAIKKTVKAGLPQKEALKALTYTPATLIGAQQLVGSLKQGMIANFLIFSDSLFAEGSVLTENWVQGQQYIINKIPKIDSRGIYNVVISNQTLPKILPDTLTLAIKGKIDNVEIELLTDTVKTKMTVRNTNESQVWKGEWKKQPFRMNTWYSNGNLTGVGEFNNGNHFKWHATLDLKFTEIAITDSATKFYKNQKISSDSAFRLIGKILTPFNAYGQETKIKASKVLLKNATIWTNEKEGNLENYDIYIENGKIAAIGKNLKVKPDTTIDATGKHITAGIIDEHSHIAIHGGVNECSQSITAQVRIGDIINSDNIDIYRNLAGGVTAVQLLHGSCNAIGGQSALIKLRWGELPEEMKIKGADGFIKFALGENVKQANWGDGYNSRFPQSRMGVEQVYIDAFMRAQVYEKNKATNPKLRVDLQLEAILEILNKKRFVTCHSYVQSEILMMMRVSEKFGFSINTFTHVLEGYKVADKMKLHGVGASTFADWWAYKMEVKDAIPYNAAILSKMGVVTAINSDDAEMARRLNHEAAKTIKYGGISEIEALKMITLNPAKLLHLDQFTGSLKVGKDADLVLWSDNPLSIYAKCEQTYVDGICLFDKNKDLLLQSYIKNDRKRLVEKLLKAKNDNQATQVPTLSNEIHWDCEDFELGEYKY